MFARCTPARGCREGGVAIFTRIRDLKHRLSTTEIGVDIVFDRYCHVAVSGEKITAEVRRRDLQEAWAVVVVSFAYEIFILLA